MSVLGNGQVGRGTAEAGWAIAGAIMVATGHPWIGTLCFTIAVLR